MSEAVDSAHLAAITISMHASSAVHGRSIQLSPFGGMCCVTTVELASMSNAWRSCVFVVVGIITCITVQQYSF